MAKINLKKMMRNKCIYSYIMLCMISIVAFSCGGGEDDPKPEETVPLTVSPTEIRLASNAGAQGTFTISCKGNWSASCSEAWVDISSKSGTDVGAVIITASTENPESGERKATINIQTATETKYVTVKQAAPDVLNLSGLDAPFDAQAGSNITAQELKITCNGPWTLEGKPEWLDISALSGDNTSTIKVWPNSANNSTSERSATLTVRSGSKSASKTVVQRAAFDSKLQVSPNTVVVLADGFAFDFTYGANVKYYYVAKFLPSDIDRRTDEEIIRDISSDESNRDTPSDGWVTSWRNQKPLTDYVICTVGYDKDGKHGALSKTNIRTKSDVNQAIAAISDVTYSDTKWEWVTTANPYVTRYYMWFNTNTNLYDTTNAAMAWFFKREMERNPDNFQPIAQSGKWERPRNGGTIFDVITWALDVDGNFSGVIDRFLGQIQSNSRNMVQETDWKESSSKRYKTLYK